MTSAASGEESDYSVPEASCGPKDRKESMQGQTTLAERYVSGPARAYNCNLELIGQFEGEGASADMEMFDQCAYYTTGLIGMTPKAKNPGVAVLDVSDSRNPRISTYLTSAAMLVAHESLEVSKIRKLLLASNPPSKFDIYDLGADCRRPILKSSISFDGEFSGVYSHAGQFVPDGATYYGATWPWDLKKDPSIVFALDTTDATSPRVVAKWTAPSQDWRTHVVSTNRDATRVYVGIQRMEDDRKMVSSKNGVAILDIGEVQARKSGAKFRLIGTAFWDDTHMSSIVTHFRRNGRSYLLVADAAGALGMEFPPPGNACESGRPSYGLTRIIDITDESSPRVISKLMLQAVDPKNCSKVMHDPTIPGGYGAFGCSVDNNEDARLVACGQHEAGVRVFDIRNPVKPREVAYYKPPARRTEPRMGSAWRTAFGNKDYTADSVIVLPIFQRHAREIWFTSTDNGFQVVQFSERFIRQNPGLFER